MTLRWIACGTLTGLAAVLVWTASHEPPAVLPIVLAVVGLLLAVIAATGERVAAIFAVAVFAIAAIVVLNGALSPAGPDEVDARLLGVGLPADLDYATGLLLAGLVVPLVILAVLGKPADWRGGLRNRRAQAMTATGLVIAAAASTVTLSTSGAIADGVAARVTTDGVDSTTRPDARRPETSADGPVPAQARQLWTSHLPNAAASRLVPGGLLVSPISGGVRVLDSRNGSELWHYRITALEAVTHPAVDIDARLLAVVSGVAMVVLDLDTGELVDRVRLPGELGIDAWEPVTDDVGSVPISDGLPIPLLTHTTMDVSAVIAVDLSRREVIEIDPEPETRCDYTSVTDSLTWPADGRTQVLVRSGGACGQPQVIRFDDEGVVQRTTVPLTAPDDECAVGCRVEPSPRSVRWCRGAHRPPWRPPAAGPGRRREAFVVALPTDHARAPVPDPAALPQP